MCSLDAQTAVGVGYVPSSGAGDQDAIGAVVGVMAPS